jgi:hypothetical protein
MANENRNMPAQQEDRDVDTNTGNEERLRGGAGEDVRGIADEAEDEFDEAGDLDDDEEEEQEDESSF